MRKLLLALFVVLLMVGQANAAPGYASDPGTGDILGQNRYQSDPHKIFRMVRYVQPSATWASETTVALGAIVVWDVTNDDGVTITTTTTSGDSAVAGIIVAQALTQDTQNNTAVQDVGKDNWTWLQTYGYNAVVDFAASVGKVDYAGSAFSTSTTAKEAAQCGVAANDGRRVRCAGIVYDTASAGDDNVEVFLIGND